MRKHLTTVLLAASLVCCVAATASAQRTMFTIRNQAFFSILGFEFAVADDQGQTVWTTPGSTDWGSIGVVTINDDPIDRTIPGTAGAKMRTVPEDQWPYETPGPHYGGPFYLDGYYSLGSGVGPEFLGNWVGLRMGSDDRPLTAVRFRANAGFDAGEIHVELWALDSATGPTLIRRFDPVSMPVTEFPLSGAGMVEFRMIVGPAVPEPSGLLAMLPATALLGVKLRRS